MFTRDSVIISHNIKTPLTSISRAVGNILQLTYGQLVKSLFANNEQGFAYDPNDLTTMFQDAAGTVPVTSVGQPVGLIRDKSGNNNHAFATSSATRPILRKNAITGAYYLAFDGTDDFLVTNSINFTSTDKVSLFAAVRIIYTSDKEAYQVVVELSGDAGVNNGSFVLTTPHGAVNTLQYGSRGTMRSNNIFSGITAEQRVITAKSKISSNLNNVRVSGGVYNNVSTAQGTGNYGNYPLYIGRRGGTLLSFSGHIYSLIGVGRLSTDSETVAIEKELAKRTGVTLSV